MTRRTVVAATHMDERDLDNVSHVVPLPRAMCDERIPPTANREVADPECDLDYTPAADQAHAIAPALCICIAFGSKNSALTLARPPA